MLWRVSPPLRLRSKPDGFILPCQPALAERLPSGPSWLHEVKWDGYRVIARKDGKRVRLWARTTSDYSNTFTRIRQAVAALPVESAVSDGEAIFLRPGNSSKFEALRFRRGQASTCATAACTTIRLVGMLRRARICWSSGAIIGPAKYHSTRCAGSHSELV
jgi:ATP-dependent DNA ligase